MGKYLLDTDVVIEWLRRDDTIVAWLKERDSRGDFLACTPVTIAEVYAGLRPSEETETLGLDLSEHGEEGYHAEA